MSILKKTLFIIFIFFIFNTCFSFSLKERIQQAEKGDYIVTFQNNIYSLLLLDDIEEEVITISEISIPKNQVNLDTFSWRKWMEENAENNVSFNIYKIDVETLKLLRCYSVSRKSFFSFSEQENFLTKLLSLPLHFLEESNRKKIGPLPMNEVLDTRAIWNPPMIIDGKRQKHPKFVVYQTTWPKDGSDLSGKIIDLYFDKDGRFAFPFWIQVSNGNIDIMLKIIDSGKNLISTKKIPE